ncbi:MAG: hypothetical protein ACI9R3_004439 [Verrucomicrobiales bacterium]
MGNETNIEQWAAQERLRAIERAAFWRGWVRRKELVSLFGISMAQASADFQKYQELNPGALSYNLNAKRYEGVAGMRCVRHVPRLEEAIGCYVEGGAGVLQSLPLVGAGVEDVGSGGVSSLGMVSLPVRMASAVVCRLVFQAVIGGCRLRVRYWSLNSGKAGWREVAPHAFGHDGYRWHVRAWCFNNGEYRDFVLSRIEDCDSLLRIAEGEEPPIDEKWNRWEQLELRPDSRLSVVRQAAIRRDYGVSKRGVLKIKIRTAMKPYLLSHLFLPGVRSDEDGSGESGVGVPRHLELIRAGDGAK